VSGYIKRRYIGVLRSKSSIMYLPFVLYVAAFIFKIYFTFDTGFFKVFLGRYIRLPDIQI